VSTRNDNKGYSILFLSADKKVRHLIPTWQDLDVLESVSNSLGPMLDFTDALSGDEYVSVSFVKPVLQL